jgi:hypothetical protein
VRWPQQAVDTAASESSRSTAAEIVVKYACAEGQDASSKVLGRQLVVPVAMTVHRTLEAATVSISRHRGRTSTPAITNADDARGVTDVDPKRHCLLALDVRNVYGQTFEVHLGSGPDGGTSGLRPCPRSSVRLVAQDGRRFRSVSSQAPCRRA